MFTLVRPAAVLLGLFTVVTGVLYPLVVTAAAQTLFPVQANGSLIEGQGKVMGSTLVGQPFDDARYFWGRPSATGPHPYNAAASTGSNLGPSNPSLADAVKGRVEALRAADSSQWAVPVPIDLVTTSASGIDPHISPAAALYQVQRVARARGLAEERLKAVVESVVEARTFGVLGEPRVNVLRLNLAVDKLTTH
jgi:K+-transporting ATPase ATPase C chain